MYIPPHFRNEDHAELLAFLRAHPLGLIVSNGPEIPSATHLPFVLREENGKLTLSSHFAKANPHVHALKEGANVLLVFSGPNAYVSPALYDKAENVPTWNFIAVHATGAVRFGDPEKMKEHVLQAMIAGFEPGYRAQWDALPPAYVEGMLKGIVAFEVDVVNLEGKFKLSQNRNAAEKERIASALGNTELTDWIKKEK